MLTRDVDCNVELDNRTFIANAQNADLFISLHANYASNKKVSGIETFYFKPSLLRTKFSTLDYTEMQVVHWIMRERSMKSHKLAQLVHNRLLNCVQKAYSNVIDRRVKYAVSQVLLNTQIPAILVEIGFVSNEKEAMLLQAKSYQKLIAHGICKGVCVYMQS